jgi:hypothetical protein
MKKNYFKILMAIAIMVMTGVSFTSCDEQLDNPVVDPTETDSETEDLVIEETAQGAKITINKLSAVSSFIDEIKTAIEKFQAENPGKQFVLDIETTATLEATETDYTLLIPNLSEFNIVINLNGNLITSAKPLTLKLDQKAGTRDEVGEKIKTNYDNVITLNLKNDDIDLILDVPGTTVFINKLNSIQILNGVSILKDGGSINTYVWAPTRNDYEMNNGEPEWVEFTASGDGWSSSYYKPNVSYTNGDPYRFKNLKIVKGKADYAKINVWEESYKLDKLTIADGVTVLLNQTPQIKEIVGEGNQTAKILFDSFWSSTDRDGNKYYQNNGYLTNVEKISNIIIDEYSNDFYKSTKDSYLGDVPADVENVIFKFSQINFRNPEAATASVKNCKFESANKDYRRAWITVPYQSTEISSFKFTFDNCEFSDEFKISASMNDRKPVIDEEGNPVWVYYYEYREEGKGWINFEVASFDDIPEEAKEKDGFDYWMGQKYETVTYKDYYATIAFIECKYADKALTPETSCFDYSWTPDGAYIRYEFDGKTYRAIQMYDPEKGKSTWILIEA